MNHKTATLGLILSLALVSSCSSIAKNLNIDNPRYTFRDVRPRVAIALPLSASSIDFDFLVEVENPNPVALRLDQLDFALDINGSHVVDGVSRDRIRIPARGIGEVRLTARADYNSLKSLFREVVDMVQGERARYQLKGRAYYDTPIGRLDFPVTIYTTGSSRDRYRNDLSPRQ